MAAMIAACSPTEVKMLSTSTLVYKRMYRSACGRIASCSAMRRRPPEACTYRRWNAQSSVKKRLEPGFSDVATRCKSAFEIPFLGDAGSLHPNEADQNGDRYGTVTCFELPLVETSGNPNFH